MSPSKRILKGSMGMTYAEVAACLFIVSIMIMPICASLIFSFQTKSEAETLREANLAAEAMLEEIKTQLTKDIKSKNKYEENKIMNEELRAIVRSKTAYLREAPSEVTLINLKDFFTQSETKYPGLYTTKRYTYEIALWNIANSPLTGSLDLMTLNMDTHSLKQAVKLYSLDKAGFCFDTYDSAYELIQFNVNAKRLKGFTDDLFYGKFIPEDLSNPGVSADRMIDVATIRFSKKDKSHLEKPVISSLTGSLHIEQSEVNDSVHQQVIYTISHHPSSSYIFPAGGQGVVLLDIRELIREFEPTVSFRFINEAGFPLIIKVLRSAGEGERLAEVDRRIDEQFPIIIDDTSKDPAVIERISDIEDLRQDNYFIAMIIRDQNPRVGKPGKIIKKMAAIYSYNLPQG